MEVSGFSFGSGYKPVRGYNDSTTWSATITNTDTRLAIESLEGLSAQENFKLSIGFNEEKTNNTRQRR